MDRTRGLVTAGLLAVLTASVAGAAQFRVQLMRHPPKIDGKVEAAEWANSIGFDGFVNLNADEVERRRVRAYVGADEDNIYIAMLSQLPDEGALSQTILNDSLKVVFDDSLEVYVCPTPDATDRVDYQFLANPLGKCGYNIHLLGNPKQDVSWRGNWEQAHSQADGWWQSEIRIPIKSMNMVAPGRKTTDGVWAINLTRNWKPWSTWSSLAGGRSYQNAGLRFTFTKEPTPLVQFEWSHDPWLPPAEGVLTVVNPSDQPMALAAALHLVRNNMPELKETKALNLAPGAKGEVKIGIAPSDPTTHFDLDARVASADDKSVYYERRVKFGRAKEAFRWVEGKPAAVLPVDFRFAYYPSKNKMRLLVDINGLPKDAKPSVVVGQIRNQVDKKVQYTVSIPIAEFKDGLAEKAFETPPLNGLYEIVVRAEGKNVPKSEVVKTFERKLFPWENAPAGRSTKVYPPFTPIKVEGKKLSTVLREHQLNDLGLWDQVVATSANTGIAKPVLAAPMRYQVKVAGAAVAPQAQPLKIVSAKEHEVLAAGGFTAGAFQATFTNRWNYDGTVRVDLTLLPTAGQKIDELTLEIPLSNESGAMIHANADRIRAPVAQKVPDGQGVVWDATKVACDDYLRNFCPYIYIGTPVRGLCFFAENDKNWGWDPNTPSLDLCRTNGQVILRVHLINRPTEIKAAQTLSFGLLAAPVKPMLNPPRQNPNAWRYRFLRDRYSVLGTDINWLALGDCGSVYPAGGDLYLWEMIARGNRERLSEEEVQKVYDYSLRYNSPYGKDRENAWRAHVFHNLLHRYGTKMVFYYNRATCQLFDECETFKDEWLPDDLRTLGKGDGIGEIKIVPAASYIDYNLYWYARSFEVGANQGVYWDNFFICPTFNTELTDAYKRPDGTIVPAAGIWQLRELAKRTFVMMNEKGLLPITMPHMTSFSPLPMLAFATVQYDWEWKYSEGDVQSRFAREYLQLVSSGELAGVWPVPLSDQGAKAEDPWTQRTFLAVRLVHELDGSGGLNTEANAKAAKPVLDMLDQQGLVVYKYWEDRPQPVKATNPQIPTIVYSVPGQEAVAVVVSYSEKDEDAVLSVDLKALGLEGGGTVVNAETNESVPLTDGKLRFPLKKHDLRVLKFAPKS